MVGCVLLDLSNPYFAEIARGIEDGLAEQGCLAVMCSSDVDTKRERRYLQMLLETRVRAVLLNPVEASPDGLAQLRDNGIPVVMLDNPRAGDDVCGVSTDGVTGGRLAAGHLLDLGHRRIALLRHDVDLAALGDRVDGVRQAVVERGLDASDVLTDVYLEPPGHHGDPGRAIDDALAGPDPCTAFLCYNDMSALRILTGLRDRGLSVPGDVSVVGYDDLAFARLLAPALTTIRLPAYDLGRAAARMVGAEARPRHEHRRLTFAPSLVVRGSTGPPPVR
jgi:LacI family transcriptional regulator